MKRRAVFSPFFLCPSKEGGRRRREEKGEGIFDREKRREGKGEIRSEREGYMTKEEARRP